MKFLQFDNASNFSRLFSKVLWILNWVLYSQVQQQFNFCKPSRWQGINAEYINRFTLYFSNHPSEKRKRKNKKKKGTIIEPLNNYNYPRGIQIRKKNEKLFFCHTMYNFDYDVTYDQEYHNLRIKIRGLITKNKSHTSYGQQKKSKC